MVGAGTNSGIPADARMSLFGNAAVASGGDSALFGADSDSGPWGAGVGYNASVGASGSCLGESCTAAASSVCVGRQCTAAANQFVVGDNSAFFIDEALVEAGANGQQWIDFAESELITVDTGDATTNSAGNLVRANSSISAVACYVTTTITTAVNYTVGITGDTARFDGTNTNVTATNSWVAADQFATSEEWNASAATLEITFNATPGAGVIRCTVYGRQFIAPTS